jgi:hypothetical protein
VADRAAFWLTIVALGEVLTQFSKFAASLNG